MMLRISILSVIGLLFTACSQVKPQINSDENYTQILKVFQRNCEANQTKKLYPRSCSDIENYDFQDAKKFFDAHFTLVPNDNKKGTLTAYYEPLLYGSFTKSSVYKYPLYTVPQDLVDIKLGTLYPQLANFRLRGRIMDKSIVPYYSRKQINENGIKAEIICYLKSRINRFFLEVQGSGRVQMDTNETIFIGYANQNGYPYQSIGKYMIANGLINKESISRMTAKECVFLRPPPLVA